MAELIDNVIMYNTHGAVGKQLVYRIRGGKTFVSKYPDMSNIIPSDSQKSKRLLFREAVKYAQSINNDPAQKANYPVHKPGQSVYHAALQDFMNKQKQVQTTTAGKPVNFLPETKQQGDGTTIATVSRKSNTMDTAPATPTTHFTEIKNTLVKIVKALHPNDNDLPMIISSWGEKLSGPETLDALNLWLHGCLEGKKEQADQVEELKALDKLEPDPIPADTSDVSG